MKKILISFVTMFVFLVGTTAVFLPIQAQADNIIPKQLQNNACPAGSELANQDFCTNSTNRLGSLIDFIANAVFGVIGTVIVIVIVVAGIQMASSSGDPNAIKSAKGRLVAAISSLVLLIAMAAIFNLIGFTTS